MTNYDEKNKPQQIGVRTLGNTSSYTGERYISPTQDPWDDYCDCDERCDKCGKKKRWAKPWIVTCHHD